MDLLDSHVIDQISKIADNIQASFEELIKQVLMKNLRPVLTPNGNNLKSVYNPNIGRNQLTYTNCDPSRNINNYHYRLTYRCIGWTGNFITNFDAKPRSMKGQNRSNSTNITMIGRNASTVPVTYNDRSHNNINQNFDTLVYLILENSMLRKITNKEGDSNYNTNVRFSDIFKFLSLIGEDIVAETDPSLSNQESARLKTAMLRYQLGELEASLESLDSFVFRHYVKMVHTINKVKRIELPELITLLGQLNFTSWYNLSPGEREYYTQTLGNEFITEFLENKLIMFLLEKERADLILTSSYLFSLSKMLFIVFGFDANAPIVVNFESQSQSQCQSHCQRERVDNYAKKHRKRGLSDDFIDIDYYDYIEIFYYFYPTLCDIINGCDCGCESCLNNEINCADIPRNFDCLSDICQMIWRYYDFSYCLYLQSIYTKVVPYNVNRHINIQTKYLFSL
jgi:hypothetical protein